jgi:MFS-type transporter involved in bile tolerance (Atg22 family)
MLMNTLLLPAGMAESDIVSMGLFLIACFAFGFTTANHWAVTQTMAGRAAAGKWTGMQNAFGNLAGVTAPWLTGVIIEQTKSFYLAFVAVAVVVVFGAFSFAFIIGEIAPIRWGPKKDAAAI